MFWPGAGCYADEVTSAALSRADQERERDEPPVAGLGQLIEFDRAADEGDDDEGDPVARAPEWIPLFPNKRKIEARDGRVWEMDDPDAVITAFNDDTDADLMIDWDHEGAEVGSPWSSVTRAPAAGWIIELRKKGKRGIEGRVKWTDGGRASVESRTYRYISPYFTRTAAEYDENGKLVELSKIRKILNAALVNMPALRMSALTREQSQTRTDPAAQAGDTMNEAILAALGLTKTGTEAEALAKIAELKVPKPVDPAAFVPKADYDTINAELAAARTELATAKTAATAATKATRDAEIETAIEGALQARKMAPESTAFWTDICQTEGGLEKFRAHMATTAPVMPSAPRNAPALPSEGEFTSASMNPADKLAARRLRLTDKQFVETRNREHRIARERLEG